MPETGVGWIEEIYWILLETHGPMVRVKGHPDTSLEADVIF
jgi:hypothetical protein